jgi:hypothetical protein
MLIDNAKWRKDFGIDKLVKFVNIFTESIFIVMNNNF